MATRILLLLLLGGLLLPLGAAAHEPAGRASGQILPLGDGKVLTTGAKRGYVYSCTQVGGGGGAFRDGPWIRSDGTWVPAEKVAVQGSVRWPQAAFDATRTGGELLLSGNGLPTNHATGTFPIAATDPAYAYDRNPNTIRAQAVDLELTGTPTVARRPSCLPMGPIGVMLNGVPIFNALDGQGQDAVAHEVQDACQGHPERSGAYHYHSLSTCLKDAGRGHSRLVGYALDGFGIHGPRGTDGRRLTNAQLDACHGHTHAVNGTRTYHYHATAEYPYTLGCFRGTPVEVPRVQSGGPLPPPPPPGQG